MVYNIAGGCTILTPAKGKWIAPEGKLFEERMIPVRIACTKEQLDIIIDLTLKYYDQMAVIYYKVSNEVVIRHRSDHRETELTKRLKSLIKQCEMSPSSVSYDSDTTAAYMNGKNIALKDCAGDLRDLLGETRD